MNFHLKDEMQNEALTPFALYDPYRTNTAHKQ